MCFSRLFQIKFWSLLIALVGLLSVTWAWEPPADYLPSPSSTLLSPSNLREGGGGTEPEPEPMGYLGYEKFPDSDGTWSVSATVPANTDCVVAVILGYDASTPGISSITFDGNAMNVRDANARNDYYSAFVYTITGSLAGTKTFACSMSTGAWASGGFAVLLYFSGIDQSTPVRDAIAADTEEFSGFHLDTDGEPDPTILTTVAGDICAVVAIADTSTDVDLEGQTKIYEDSSSYNSSYTAAAYKTASGVSTTMDAYGDYVGGAAIALIPAASIELPTVTTQAASAVDDDSATLNGNITDTGGENCDARGFVYDTSTHADPGDTAPNVSDYANYTTASGSFGTGAYTGSATSLTAWPQLYYVRAWAHNSEGYAYGDEITFRCTQALPDGSYSTTFDLTENPIYEGGVWLNGETDGGNWGDVKTSTGVARGDTLPDTYADPTAILKGTWSADQYAQATVSITGASSGYEEVELRLRSAISSGVNRGYEVIFAVNSTSNYIQLVVWNGDEGDFDYLEDISGYVEHNDVIKAQIVGTVITVWLNEDQIIEYDTVSDAVKWSDGSPGIGFYKSTGSFDDFGLTDFEAGAAGGEPTPPSDGPGSSVYTARVQHHIRHFMPEEIDEE